jgi:hypothetical protein
LEKDKKDLPMVKHKDSGPVSMAAFKLLHDWLLERWNSGKELRELLDSASEEKATTGQQWLMDIRNMKWPQQPDGYFAKTCNSEKEAKGYKSINTYVRKSLAVASRENLFKYSAQTAKYKNQFRLAWGKDEEADEEPTGIKRILWFRVPFHGSFDDMLLLGAISMANECGVALNVVEIHSSGEVYKQAAQAVSYLEKEGNSEKIRNETSLVFCLVKNREVTLAKEDGLKEYHVITTGYPGATVSQNNDQLGAIIAKAVLRLPEPQRRTILAICPMDSKAGGPCFERVETFRRCLLNAGKGVELKVVFTEYGKFEHAHEFCLQARSKAKTKKLKFFDFDIIFATTGDIAERLTILTHEYLDRKHPPQIFAADITPSLLRLMREPSSPLKAICGVDAYSYGRLIVQRAINTDIQSQIPALAPQLISQQYILENKVLNYQQLLRKHPELCVDKTDLHKDH